MRAYIGIANAGDFEIIFEQENIAPYSVEHEADEPTEKREEITPKVIEKPPLTIRKAADIQPWKIGKHILLCIRSDLLILTKPNQYLFSMHQSNSYGYKQEGHDGPTLV